MQSLKIPEAVVAFAQAAAKTNDLHGWPLWSPMQMQKCDKCSLEFCSPINYKRHIRVHRRSLNIDKDSTKNRGLLGAFWDKLSLDEAKEIVSIKDVLLEDIPGSSIIHTLALSPHYRKLGFSSLPHVYAKAGAALLDVVQARHPRFHMSSKEFFSLLDDASEKTFLRAGTALSVQKFIFDGDAGKVCLEMKNLAACTCFLVEQKLVKAWIADKDAEALRCQKLLVEEEEAAKKRQALLMEKKRMKKLRQKEQREKDQIDKDRTDENEDSCITNLRSSTEASNLSFESGLDSLDISSTSLHVDPVPAQLLDAKAAEVGIVYQINPGDVDMNSRNGSAVVMAFQNVDTQTQMWFREIDAARRSSPKRSRTIPNGFNPVQVNTMKSATAQKHNCKDQRLSSTSNIQKVWTRKTKLGCEEVSNVRGLMETGNQPDQSNCSEVLIGSICITLGESRVPIQNGVGVTVLDHCDSADDENVVQESSQLKRPKPDNDPSGAERTVKLWWQVVQQEFGGPIVTSNEKIGDRIDGNAIDHSNEKHPTTDSSAENCSSACKDSLVEESGGVSTDLRHFSSCILNAKAFLEQRWKGALAAGLVLSAEPEPLDLDENHDGKNNECAVHIQHDSSGKVDNILTGPGTATVTAATEFSKIRANKCSTLKFVPKQRMDS